MSNKRITQLNVISSVDVNNDQLAITDVSATETMKVTPQALCVAILAAIPGFDSSNPQKVLVCRLGVISWQEL